MRSLALPLLALVGCSYPQFGFAAAEASATDDTSNETSLPDTAIGDDIDTGVLADSAADATLTDVTDATPDACSCPLGELCESGMCKRLASCGAIKAAFPALTSGAFMIDPDGSGPLAAFRAFCEMSADGGGWTLALKLDGTKTTFAYAAALWTNETLLNTWSTDNSTTEAKFRSFLDVPFTRIRVRMFDGTTARYFPLDVASTSLRALFAGPAVTTTAGRPRWLTLLGDPSLQAFCSAEGINREFLGGGPKIRMRLGIVGNNEDHCTSPDSYIGFGVSMDVSSCYAGTNPGIVVGNLASTDCAAPKDKALATFGFLYVR